MLRLEPRSTSNLESGVSTKHFLPMHGTRLHKIRIETFVVKHFNCSRVGNDKSCDNCQILAQLTQLRICFPIKY